VICAGEERHALYRFYDARENLLYVGITDDPWRRWREHVRIQSWYPQVKHQAVTWYENKAAAEVAEYVAIRCEHPRFNIAGAVRPVVVEVPVKPPAPPLPADETSAQRELELLPALESPDVARRNRTLFVILTCILWAFLPSMPGMPLQWHSTWVIALAASTSIPVAVVIAIASAGHIHRFGRWLDRNFGGVASEAGS